MDSINLLLGLLCIHLIIDFYLQPDSWIKNKKRHPWTGYAIWGHALLHGAGCSVLLFFLSDYSIITIAFFGVIVLLSHYLIDATKASMENRTRYFVLDQIAHLLVLIALVGWLGKDTQLRDTLLNLTRNTEALAILSALLVVLKPTSLLMSVFLNQFKPSAPASTLPRAGEMIGYLERILIVTFVVAGQWSGIGFLLAAKSVFRFGDLAQTQQVRMTEYVILGTLLSTMSAIFIGLLLAKFLSWS